MQKSPYQYEAARKPSEDSVSVDAPANKKESFRSSPYGLPSCSSQSERKRRRFLVSRFRFGLTLFAELFALPLLDGDWLHVLFILL